MSHKTGEKQGRERDSKGRFVKGTSGNPGGRPKHTEEFKKACEELVLPALEVLKEIMLNKELSASVRVKAAEVILDRALGKPFQAVQVDQIDTTVRIIDEDPEGAEYNG